MNRTQEKEAFRFWLNNMHGYGLLLTVKLKSALKMFRASMEQVDEEKLFDDANQ